MIHLLLTLLFSFSALAASLPDELAARRTRVPEFAFIAEEAKKIGVRAWLFGGTAAAYAHYVKWDLDREDGDPRFTPERFDYDYTNIYRSTQDLDIVIDGTPEQAREIQAALAKVYPHFLGTKGQSAWEVRLLRTSIGDKLAILDNPDFLNQHTDSNSTGMVELTETPKGESPVRDVMDWNSHDPNFLKDVREGKLHYYFNPKHGTTKFAQEGRNPPILSVIRYLTKALQFELELRPEDLAQVKKIIADFNPEKDTKNEYVKRWLLEKENGRKLVQNAVNMEYARKLLDETGLRAKLLAVPGADPGTPKSLGWWLNKQPLESKPLGEGKGKTAAQLGIDVVAHETNSFEAWESITKSPKGTPNVFISRAGAPGEAAMYGDGFYTRVGREGARGTHLNIRFHLDPTAREGTDFLREGDYVIVRNREALRVIPESLNWDYPEFFRFMLSGEGTDSSNQAQFQKLNRRLKNQRLKYTPHQLDDILRTEIRNAFDHGRLPSLTAARSLVKEYWPEAVAPEASEVEQGLHDLFVNGFRKNYKRPGFIQGGDAGKLAEIKFGFAEFKDGGVVNRAMQALAFGRPHESDLDFIRKHLGGDIYQKALARVAMYQPRNDRIDAVIRLSDLNERGVGEKLSGMVLKHWLDSGAEIDEFEINYLCHDSRTARAVLRNYIKALASPKFWKPDEAPRFRAFLEKHADKLKKYETYAHGPAGPTCAAYFASLPSFSRYPRATLTLVGTGSAALTLEKLRAAEREDIATAKKDGAALKEAFDKASSARDYVRALAALSIPAATPIDERSGHGFGGLYHFRREEFRDEVDKLLSERYEAFLKTRPDAEELSRYLSWMRTISYGQLTLSRVLRDSHPSPRQLLTAREGLAAYDINSSGSTWKDDLVSFFRGKPSRAEVQDLLRQLPRDVDPSRVAVQEATGPEDLLNFFETKTSAPFSSIDDGVVQMLKFDPTPEQRERFRVAVEQHGGDALPVDLKYADDPHVLLPKLGAASFGTIEAVLEFLGKDQRPQRLVPKDFRALKEKCTETCGAIVDAATSAARSPAEFIEAVSVDARGFEPGSAKHLRLQQGMGFGAQRFFKLEPSAEDVRKLRDQLEAIGGWDGYADGAVPYARNKEELEYYLTPPPGGGYNYRLNALRSKYGLPEVRR